MANLAFAPCHGAVEIRRSAFCPEGSSPALLVQLDDEELNGDSALIGIVQGVAVALSGNYQFMHTVNNFIYFYAFGDRIGALTITGIGFVRTCGSTKGQLLDVYEKYMSKRASRRRGSPSTITLTAAASAAGAAKTFIGFLTAFNMDIKTSDVGGTVGYWTMKFDVLPSDGATTGGTTTTGGA
jgi:hypothetical protein